MQEIKLELTIEETNLILKGLGELPFNKVYALIGKIQSQANTQVKSQNGVELSQNPQEQ